MKLILFVIFIGLCSTYAAPQELDQYEIQKQFPFGWEVEARVERGMTGILDLVQAFIDLLQNIVGIMTGNSNLQDIVTSIQNFFFTLQTMVNMRWIVNQVPFFGSFFSPILEAFSSILGDSGILAGLLSQILVGPVIDEVPEPVPATNPPRRGIFG